MARPSKYSLELSAKICANLYLGNDRRTACESVGIGLRTFEKWMAHGMAHPKTDKGRFRRQVIMCEAGATKQMVNVVFQAALAGDTKAAMAWLRRRRPDDWGEGLSEGELLAAEEAVALATGKPRDAIHRQALDVAQRAGLQEL